MPKVNLPRASWDAVMLCLEKMDEWHLWITEPLRKEIEDQVYSQEY